MRNSCIKEPTISWQSPIPAISASVKSEIVDAIVAGSIIGSAIDTIVSSCWAAGISGIGSTSTQLAVTRPTYAMVRIHSEAVLWEKEAVCEAHKRELMGVKDVQKARTSTERRKALFIFKAIELLIRQVDL